MMKKDKGGIFGFGILSGSRNKLSQTSEDDLTEVKQGHFEVIACVLNPINQKWSCFSAVEVPWEKGKFELLEANGRKFSNEYELIGFKPEEGKTKSVSFHKKSILNQLYQAISEKVA